MKYCWSWRFCTTSTTPVMVA